MIPYLPIPVPLTGSVPGLGAYPDGDPEAIRALAAQLRGVAATLAGAATPGIDGWRSDRAAAVRASLTTAATAAHRTGDELRGLATSLDHAADTLETDQRAWVAGKRRLLGGTP